MSFGRMQFSGLPHCLHPNLLRINPRKLAQAAMQNSGPGSLRRDRSHIGINDHRDHVRKVALIGIETSGTLVLCGGGQKFTADLWANQALARVRFGANAISFLPRTKRRGTGGANPGSDDSGYLLCFQSTHCQS
jgi:hypothetical protein